MGIYTDYFQKSKVFLYPLLKIRKGLTHVPIETYVAWENVYGVEDCRLFCEYKTKNIKSFVKFSNQYLNNNPLFDDYIKLDDDRHLYIFDLNSLKTDYKRFISGKYSQLTLKTKTTIIDLLDRKKYQTL